MPTDSIIILGNGFDVAFGYRTKYSDFYSASEKLYYFANNGNALCRHILDNIKGEFWSDLECGLYKYSLAITEQYGVGNTVQASRFEIEFIQLREALFDYLDQASSTPQLLEKQHLVIGIDLEWKVLNAEYLTFNYSSVTFSNVAGEDRSFLNIDDSVNSDLFIYQHGSIFNTAEGYNNKPSSIVLGIDEKEQEVEPLHSFLYKSHQDLFNPNISIKHILSKRNYFIFGCSFGISDASYFRRLFDKKQDGKRYVIYHFGESNLGLIKKNIQHYCEDYSDFITRNNVAYIDLKNDNARSETRRIIQEILS